MCDDIPGHQMSVVLWHGTLLSPDAPQVILSEFHFAVSFESPASYRSTEYHISSALSCQYGISS